MSISLNPQQKKAAETLTGPVLVLAGAGAGKTMTLTARIIKLILSGVLPQNILAITFTNKAAAEMKTRVNKAIENHPKINFPTLDYGFIPFVSTFHALGVFIIREHHTNLNISKYFSIYDRSDMKRAIKESLDNLNLDPKEWEVKNIISFISKNKGNFVDLKKFMSSGAEGSFYTETMGKIWTGYEKVKTNDKALDFDDLLLESAKLLDSNKEIREHYLKK
jgi:DNA helicase-2/ATP-dependent DNA helicase PcrA